MSNIFLERDLEDIIFENQEEVVKKGFPPFYKNVRRQFNMPYGGICDIITWEDPTENSFKCKIFELKRRELDINAVSQIIGYGRQVVEIFTNKKELSVDLILVGSDWDDNILNLFEWGVGVMFVNYDFCLDGIKFENLCLPTIFDYRKVYRYNPNKISDKQELFKTK